MFDHPYIIAEIGINHNGDYDLAEKMVIEAAGCGVNAVKFQNFRTEDFIFDESLKFTYQSQGKTKTESMWDLFKRTEMGAGWIPKLKGVCDQHCVDFISTPTNESGVQELVECGVKMLKNGSDYLTHVSLLKSMGKTDLPVIISTGMADESEIRDAIAAVQKGGSSPVTLLHCTSVYPTMPIDVNLKRMVALHETFNIPVGFSDHTMGYIAAVQAVTLGAGIIEKHFTLDHNLSGPDHWFSLEPEEFKAYVKNIRDAEQNLGSISIEPAKAERSACRDSKLGIRVRRDMVIGQKIDANDLMVAKPADGLPPREMNNLIGRILLKNITKGTAITFDYVNFDRCAEEQPKL